MANKVSKGQPLKSAPTLKASFINDLVDVVNAYKGGGLGGRSGTTAGGKGWPLKVRNLTGADRSRGEVVQLGELLLNKLDPRNLWFEGNTPSEKPTERFAILAAPLPANDIGPIHLSGVCVAKVNVTDADHGYATPEESSYVLKSAESGPVEIMSPVTGTGEQECAVLLGAAGGEGASVKLVTIAGAGEDGDLVEPDSGCLWEGTLASVSESEEGGYCSEPITAGDPVWIFNAARLAPEKLPKGSRHWAVPAGSFDPQPPDPEEEEPGGESDERPVYVILYEDVVGKVKVNEDDELAYLEDQFEGHNAEPAYEDGKDLTLSLDTEEIEGDQPEDPTDQKLRIFIDASAIAGYDSTKEQILTHEADGGFRWVDVNTEECD